MCQRVPLRAAEPLLGQGTLLAEALASEVPMAREHAGVIGGAGHGSVEVMSERTPEHALCAATLGPGTPAAEVCCGRPFRVEGQPRMAALEQRRDWLRPLGAARNSELSQRIAAEWLEDARLEHASIASFARFTLDLLAFAAPPALVEWAQRAALDEVEHARLCFGLAVRYGASELGPGPLPASGVCVSTSLREACVAAFDEGCVGETLAALQARAASDLASDPEVRRALEQIASQEAQHAELAWHFVSWAAADLGPELPRVLAERLTPALAAPLTAESEPDAVVQALHDAGRLTAADKACIVAVGLREVIAPCLAELAASRPASAVRAGDGSGRELLS